jgi:hypothetical protein
MGTFAVLVRKIALVCFVFGLMMLFGGADMVEGIWGLFTRFEGVPDMTQAGWNMLALSIPVGFVGLVLTGFAMAIGSPCPGNPEQP